MLFAYFQGVIQSSAPSPHHITSTSNTIATNHDHLAALTSSKPTAVPPVRRKSKNIESVGEGTPQPPLLMMAPQPGAAAAAAGAINAQQMQQLIQQQLMANPQQLQQLLQQQQNLVLQHQVS